MSTLKATVERPLWTESRQSILLEYSEKNNTPGERITLVFLNELLALEAASPTRSLPPERPAKPGAAPIIFPERAGTTAD